MYEFILYVMMIVFGFGAIGSAEQGNRDNYTDICVACILAIAIINTF